MTEETVELSWNTIPTLILISTFKNLNYKDRLNAALACHHWLSAFDSSYLWQEMELIMDGDLVDDSRKALQFIRKHATSVKKLKIHFRRCRSQRIREVMDNIQLLFQHLASFSDLHVFELKNFSFQQLWDTSRWMMSAFRIFLGSQQLLKVKFFKTYFSEQEGIDILGTLVTYNKWIQVIGLRYYFEQGVDVYESDAWKRLISALPNLKKIELDYYCISEEILEILSVKKELQTLSLLCDQSEGLRHIIPSDNWKRFKEISPSVNIKYEMVDVVTFHQFLQLMPEMTQVNEFTYKCGFSLRSDTNLRRHGISVLQYLSYAFQTSLRKISLDFGFVNIPRLEDAILQMISLCSCLEAICLAGVLSPSLARRICEVVLMDQKEILTISLQFYFCNFESVEEMNRMQEYQQLLRAKGIKLHFNLLNFQVLESNTCN